MARESTRERKARELRERHEGMFGDLNIDQLKDAIVRSVKMIEDFKESKKAAAKSWNDQIKEKTEEIQYCSERIDYLNAESARENFLENEQSNN